MIVQPLPAYLRVLCDRLRGDADAAAAGATLPSPGAASAAAAEGGAAAGGQRADAASQARFFTQPLNHVLINDYRCV